MQPVPQHTYTHSRLLSSRSHLLVRGMGARRARGGAPVGKPVGAHLELPTFSTLVRFSLARDSSGSGRGGRGGRSGGESNAHRRRRRRGIHGVVSACLPSLSPSGARRPAACSAPYRAHEWLPRRRSQSENVGWENRLILLVSGDTLGVCWKAAQSHSTRPLCDSHCWTHPRRTRRTRFKRGSLCHCCHGCCCCHS